MTRRACALFAGVSVLWGVQYLFIKVAVDRAVARIRGLVALRDRSCVLLPLAAAPAPLRDLPRWPLIAFATVELIVPAAESARRAARGLVAAAILIATVPLFVNHRLAVAAGTSGRRQAGGGSDSGLVGVVGS